MHEDLNPTVLNRIGKKQDATAFIQNVGMAYV